MANETRMIDGHPIRTQSVEVVVSAVSGELSDLLALEACTLEEACMALSVLRIRLENQMTRGYRLRSDNPLRCALSMLRAGDSLSTEMEVVP